MEYKLKDLIDIPLLQEMQDKLNLIYSFPSAIIDNDGNILTAVAWQDICTKFHRVNPMSNEECIKSDRYIIDHLNEADPAVSYQCPHGLIDNATPIIINGKHLGTFFTGQFFLEKPDMDFFRKQAKKYGFNEKAYLEAVEKVPIWTKEKLKHYLDFIKEFILLIANSGLKNLKETEAKAELKKINEELTNSRLEAMKLMNEAVDAKKALEATNKKLIEEIAERRRTELSLIEREDRIKSISNNFTAGMIYQIIEDSNGNRKFTYLSDSVKQLYGATPEEIMADPSLIYSRIHEDDIKGLMEAEEESLKTLSTFKAESRVKKPSGEIRWSYFVSNPRKMEDGTVCWDGIEFVITERKLAEEALKESELKLREAQRIAHMGNWELDILTNKLTWSDEIFRIFEIDRSLFGASYEAFLNAIHPEDRDLVNTAYKESLKTRKTYGITHRLLMTDGRVKYVHEHCETYYSADGTPLRSVGTVQDITESKQNEIKLAEHNKFIESIVNMTPDILYIYDIIDRKNIYISNSVQKILGYSIEEIQNMGDRVIPLLMHPDDFKEYMEKIIPLYGRAKDNESIVHQYRMRHKSGEWCWISSNETIYLRDPEGAPKQVFGIMHDITEIKKTEKELQEARAILQAAMDQSPAGIAIADAPYGTLRYVNDAGLLIRGGDRKAIVKDIGIDKYVSSWQILDLDGTPLKTDEVPLARAILFGENCNREFIVRRADGDDRIVMANAAPIKDEHGKVMAGIVVFLDVTEAKEAEKEKQRLQEQLAQSRKMDSVGRLAGGIAHDFNNMLGIILGCVELSMLEVAPANPVYENLEQIRRAAERSANLTRQLLAFARKQIIRPVVINLNETVEHMLKILKRLIGEDIDLIWKPCSHLVLTKMDQAQIDQILLNLLVNARDSISGHGKIIIETDNVMINETDCNLQPGSVPGDYVMLIVSDSGCGMKKEILANIFEPFFTTKELGKGTGLGLATIYGIVKQNNGFINVYSEEGKGATFRVYLPKYVEETCPDTLKEPSDAITGGMETILIVEDEPMFLDMTEAMIKKLGYKVITANKPVDAISLAEKYEGKIHLLITDVIMPSMNGRDLAGKLAVLRPDIKCLFMSGYTDSVIAHHGALDKGVNFISKPFTLKDLASKIREALGK